MGNSAGLRTAVRWAAAWWAGAAALWAAETTQTVEFRPARMFTDHMVIQRDQPVRVFGFAGPGAKIQVKFRGHTATAETGRDGEWLAELPPGNAGGPFTLEISDGKKRFELRDVLAGDVWFCTGQSNMAWFVSQCNDARREMAAAENPQLRLLWIDRIGTMEPQRDVPYTEGWKRCTPAAVRSFSATAYYFARELQPKIGVPVGLIDASWGGPPITHFMPHTNRNPGILKQSNDALRAAQASHPAWFRAVARCLALEKDPAALARLATAEFPDAPKESVRLPGDYSKNELKGFSGIARFRRTVEIPAAWAGKNLILELGKLWRPDRTFFNGRAVGGKENLLLPLTRDWDPARRYRVPADAVRAGANTIALLVGDLDALTWIGGVWDPMRIYPEGDSGAAVSLAGDWEATRLLTLPERKRTYGNGYNGMIYPFFRFPVKGILFYQGESDARKEIAEPYFRKHCALIRDYRKQWGAEVPFLFVQLAAHNRKNDPGQLPVVRDAQRRTLDALPKVGMASALDIGNPVDIHPTNKQETGRRLALQARKYVYGETRLTADGPLFDRAERAGNTAVKIHFRPTGSPLEARGDGKLAGFEAAADDGKFHPVSGARIDGPDTVTLPVPAALGGKPVRRVRYLWENCPVVTLGNRAGLPASSFAGEIR